MTSITWTIAGLDSSGGAGLSADLRVFQQFGVQACAIMTAVTAQNTRDVSAIHFIPAKHIAAQFSALENEFFPNVIKIGMLGCVETINEVLRFLASYQGHVILDPVMIASSGKALFEIERSAYIKQLALLFPQVDLLTPNLHEAEMIYGQSISSEEDIKKAGRFFLSLGIKNILIKGGHAKNDFFSQDYWTNGQTSVWLTSPRQVKKNYRGTGCTLSSAIAASLALGYTMLDALVISKMYVNQGMRLSSSPSFLHHAAWPENVNDLPYFSDHPLQEIPRAFLNCGETPLGLYPIVDSSAWVEKLLPLGITTIQLRIKNKTQSEIAKEIKRCIQLAKQYQARLFINDYWKMAIEQGAYGVHLGQEDMAEADVEKIYHAGLRLGLSTHAYHEVARAHCYRPSYIACGPIFPTTSKVMPIDPQGIVMLKRWQRTLSPYRLVAIGGINRENITDVLSTGVDGVAMISAITQAKNPQQEVQRLLEKIAVKKQ